MTPPLIVAGAVAGILRVTGEDAFPYLQSQFSNDLRRPDSARPATYGLWLTRKGRVAADSIALRLGPEEFLLISFFIPTEKLLEKVFENVIADAVEAEPTIFQTLTFVGENAGRTLRDAGLPVPDKGSWDEASGVIVIASRRGAESYEALFSETPEATEIFLRIRNATADSAALEALRIRSGVARVPDDCGPGDLPQEAGLVDDAVSFSKGCYLGQEVMARLHAQGRATREPAVLFLARPVATLPRKLYSGDAEAGEIRSQAACEKGYAAFALLRTRVAEGVSGFSETPGGEIVAHRFPAS